MGLPAAPYINNYIYDRDYNVTGTVQGSFDFKPSYGTVVSFAADLTSYTTVDNYIYTMPRGLNHLQIEIEMPFENRTEFESRKIISFFESLRGTGYFSYTDPASIYQPVNLFCNDIQTDFTVNNIYNLKVNLSTDQAAPLLKWNGMFITGTNLRGNWSTSTDYFKYDIVRHTGSATYPKNTSNLYDSYYYCMKDHTSQSSPINNSNLPSDKWSQDFFYQPTYSTVLNKKTSVLKTDLPYSFVKKSDFGKHANILNRFDIQFKGVSDVETRSILHFLASKQGYRKFQYKIPKIYNRNKFFFAPEWQHTFVYKNVNDISITLVEDPIGVRRTY
jgi:phage-related protein